MWQDFKNVYHLLRAILSNICFRFPSKKLRVIGVTGTDGKTTTSSLIYHILNEAGCNVSMITSVGAKIDGKDYDIGFHVTTPSTWQLQHFISKIRKSISRDKDNYLVLELTSHAIDQYRAWGVDFEIGVLTNVTNEHLDYHKTYEEYVKTKFKLPLKAQIGILNKDDESYKAISSFKEFKNKKFITYAIKEKADVTPSKFPFESSLTERFNKYNILAAVSVCRELGIDSEKVKKAIKTFTLPIGRVEEVYKKDFSVVIDFAHTSNSIEKILLSVKEKTGVNGRVIHVFGSAGKRDPFKRPLMGKASSKLADIIILTAEDPRNESVEKINQEISQGIDRKFKLLDSKKYKDVQVNRNIYFKIDDRLEAIKFAISIAKRGDVVILTGKSHEKSMNFGKGEVPWNEYEAVKAAIQNKMELKR